MLKLILLLFLAHLFSDFIFQSQNMCDKKLERVFNKYHFFHFLIVFVFSYICSLDFNLWVLAIVIAVIHILVDMKKSQLILKNPDKDYFFLDQTIHLITIIIVTIVYMQLKDYMPIIDIDTKYIAIALGFILCSKPANIIIKYLFKAFDIKTNDSDSDEGNDLSIPNAGKLIGISERYLALILIIAGAYEAVGLIIAAKSVLRINSTQRSEYVLVGTLLSFGIAIFSGLIINLLL